MRVISFIDDSEIIKKILKHLDLWDVRPKPPPCANPPEADRLKPLLSMINPQCPAWMIRLRSCFFGAKKLLSVHLLRRDKLPHRC